MRSFECTCGNSVFFENSQCVSCGSDLGWCPVCAGVVSLIPGTDGEYQCASPSCGAKLRKCHNYAVEQVCNRCFKAEQFSTDSENFCDYCRFNDTIPDLAIPDNREKWARLETAKRRLLYTLDLLRLPYGLKEDGVATPLGFDFKADLTIKSRWWWQMGREERVYTGHADGKITINIREADPVEREKARVAFQEAHRTIIGHFRHEIAHYYWQLLIEGICEDEYIAVFGDHNNPGYSDAQAQYYENGPRPDWQREFVSAYATMHPWEDFAETFATYLDIVSVLDTAMNMGVVAGLDPVEADIHQLTTEYRNLGVVLNEMNRSMGLHDLVPEVLVAPVVTKLAFVHDLVHQARSSA